MKSADPSEFLMGPEINAVRADCHPSRSFCTPFAVEPNVGAVDKLPFYLGTGDQAPLFILGKSSHLWVMVSSESIPTSEG
jgi:hypothetical protein